MDMHPASRMSEEFSAPPQDNTLLIVDDDRAFLQRLARAMETRGFAVEAAGSVDEGLARLRQRPPAFAVVDMRLDDGNGIDVIAALKEIRPDSRAVILTGYGNIATAVSAVKLVRWITLQSPLTRTTFTMRWSRHPTIKHVPLRTRCPPTASVGNTFSGSTNSAIATFPKQHAD